MELDELRDKWTAFLSASISAKYGNSEKDKECMIEKLQEFDKIWEEYKNEQSRTGKDNLGESEETRASV